MPLPASRRAWALLLPLVLYALALNPWFLPGTYDNIVFYHGARALAGSGSFQFAGRPVVDWAPGLPVLLAVPMLAGVQAVWVAKLCILACVGAGLFFTFRCLEAEARPRPLLTCVLFALLPTGFMMGTRIMTEWPFIALSFLFLGLLRALDGPKRGTHLAVLAGLVFGAAALTRWIGVLLGAAVLVQAVSRLLKQPSSLPSASAGLHPPTFSSPFLRIFASSRESRLSLPAALRAVVPEAIAAAVGLGLFGLWKLKLTWQIASGLAEPSTYFPDYWYLGVFETTDFTGLPAHIGDLLFHARSVGRHLGVDPRIVSAAAAVPGLLAVWGAALRFRTKGPSPGDCVALATLGLFAILDHNPQIRYLLPIAPFLLSWFITGLEAALAVICSPAPLLPRSPARWAAGWGLAAWAVTLALLDGHLLFAGNVAGTHAGLSMLVTKDAGSFYRGSWKDLYDAGRFIAGIGPVGNVAVTGEQDKYVFAFSGRPTTVFSPRAPVDFLVETASDRVPAPLRTSMELREAGRFGSVRVYRAAGPRLTRDVAEAVPGTTGKEGL